MQSYSVSSDFTEKLLNFENVSPADNEIPSLMDTTVCNKEPSAIIDRYMDNKLGEAIHKAIQPHNAECRKEAQAEKQDYIDLILPKAVSDFTTLVIERNVTESLEADVLAKSSSQPKSTYEASASLSEYELTKILLDKMEESKSHLRADYKRKLYGALIKTPLLDQTEGRKEGSLARKLSHKKIQELPSHIVDDSGVQKNQEFDTGNNDEQPEDEAAPKNDWFRKPERPPSPDPDWNKRHVRIMKKTRSPYVMSSIG
ncbi:hypothetical protein Tco_0474629 [Tanacetum coccineum]